MSSDGRKDIYSVKSVWSILILIVYNCTYHLKKHHRNTQTYKKSLFVFIFLSQIVFYYENNRLEPAACRYSVINYSEKSYQWQSSSLFLLRARGAFVCFGVSVPKKYNYHRVKNNYKGVSIN